MGVRIDRVRLLNRLGPFDFIDFQFIALGKQRGMMSPRILQHDIKPGPSLARLRSRIRQDENYLARARCRAHLC